MSGNSERQLDGLLTQKRLMNQLLRERRKCENPKATFVLPILKEEDEESAPPQLKEDEKATG